MAILRLAMAHSSPARWLAPIALVAGSLALVVVLATSSGSSSTSPDSSPTVPAKQRSKQAARKAAPADKPATTPVTQQQHTYTVQSGDYLSTVSEKTGLSVERLRELNPGLDANSMSVGQEIRLAPGKP
jgi:LysM repeat protein